MRNKKTKILALLLSVGFAIPHNLDVLASELEDQEFQSSAEEELLQPSAERNEESKDKIEEGLEGTDQLSNISSVDDLEIKTGWESEDGIWYYFDESGNKITNEQSLINDKYYRFDETGKMITGWYETNDKAWYYYVSSGAMKTGWANINKKWYYFDEEGQMTTGWQEVNGEVYYFNLSGHMQTGWVELNDDWYYFNSSGNMATGWLELNQAKYYLRSNGSMVTGSHTINSVTHFFAASGRWEGNWVKTSNGWQYIYPNGKYAKNKWKYLNDDWYYFNDSAYMTTGWQYINGRWYFLKANGSMATEWIKSDNNWYYLDSNGHMLTGWIKINKDWFYLRNNGSMVTGDHNINGVTNVFSSSGVWLGSWQKNSIGWWYRYPNNDYPQNTWKSISNQTYHFDEAGYMTTGWLKDNNNWYYFKSDGSLVKENTTIGGNLHLFSSNGVWQGNWRRNSKGWWFNYPNETYPKDGWTVIDNERYYFNTSGYMVIGWKKLNNHWYYLDSSGAMVTGLNKIDNKWYTFKDDGIMLPESKIHVTLTPYEKSLEEAINIQITRRPQTDAWPGWKDATKEQVAYYLNPTNFLQLNPYQFLKLSGTSNISLTELNAELAGKGVLDGHGKAFLDAGKQYDVNEIYLLAHSVLETGHGSSQLATGVLVDTVKGESVEPQVVYNMFGIGAYDSNPLKYGSERAYEEGWFTPEEAIIGGAQWIAGNYINHASYQQDTLYKMRWNPKMPGVHQYATDVGWAYKQTRVMDMVAEISERNNSIVLRFDIPVYSGLKF